MSASPAPSEPFPLSWFNSIDSFASIVVVPPLVALWAWQARRGREPTDVEKIGIGCALTGGFARCSSRPALPWPDPTARSE